MAPAIVSAMLTGDWSACRFSLEPPLHSGGSVFFPTREKAAGSPLAEALFGLPEVVSVKISPSSITVCRAGPGDWAAVSRAVAEVLRGHAASGRPALSEEASPNIPSAEEIARRVQKVLDEQVNPSLASHGGGISLLGVDGASVRLSMTGGCQGCAGARMTLRHSVESALRAAVPEIDDVIDATDHASGESPYQAS
jgi:Fe-S cluster biogenesis protein NfuA